MDWRQRGQEIVFDQYFIPIGDTTGVRQLQFTGRPSLLIPQLNDATTTDDLREITDEHLPVLYLSAEIYQLALEHAILEYLQDPRATGLFSELMLTIDNVRPELRTVRVISTEPAGVPVGLAGLF